jgi:CheY-like chemotaxis protein
MSAEPANHSADLDHFFHADPNEVTPVIPFPTRSSLPPDLFMAVEPQTQRAEEDEDEKTVMKDIRDTLQDVLAVQERLVSGLLDEGGTLDAMAKSWRAELAAAVTGQNQKIDQIRNEMATKFDDLIDTVTVDRARVERLSESAIKVELPFTCLVVDDDAELRVEIEKILAASGIAVLVAQDAEDAFSLLKGEAPIDVVLADINLHGRGAEFVKRVRKEHPRVDVVITTGSQGREASEALDAGACSFVAKPFSSNDHLRLAVIRAAEYRRQRSASSPRA